MGSSQHKSPPHQARAFRRLVLRSAHFAVLNDPVCISRTNIYLKKQNQNQNRIGDSGRWTDLTIRIVVT